MQVRVKGYDKALDPEMVENVIKALYTVARCIGKPSVMKNPENMDTLYAFLQGIHDDPDISISREMVDALNDIPHPDGSKAKSVLSAKDTCNTLLNEDWEKLWKQGGKASFNIKNEDVKAVLRATSLSIEPRQKNNQPSYRVKYISPLDKSDPATARYVSRLKDWLIDREYDLQMVHENSFDCQGSSPFVELLARHSAGWRYYKQRGSSSDPDGQSKNTNSR